MFEYEFFWFVPKILNSMVQKSIRVRRVQAANFENVWKKLPRKIFVDDNLKTKDQWENEHGSKRKRGKCLKTYQRFWLVSHESIWPWISSYCFEASVTNSSSQVLKCKDNFANENSVALNTNSISGLFHSSVNINR